MFEYDFAISYAGENRKIAKEIYDYIKAFYVDFSIFYAPKEKHQLIGQDGESFFKELFLKCKEVIVIISAHYKQNKWTRYEWDIILERNKENRFIPIRLDNTNLLGLPSTIIYETYNDNSAEIAEMCINKLLHFEETKGIKRSTEFENSYNNIKDSEGALDKAYQLVADSRKRTPLGDINYPESEFSKSYEIVETSWSNFSVIRRIILRILLPENLSKNEIEFNINHCITTVFNKNKPDALGLFAYCKDKNFDGFDSIFNVARADFAPYGKWEKAEEGYAYNLPAEKFRTKIEYFDGYFDTSVKKRTADSIAKELVLEVLNKRNKD